MPYSKKTGHNALMAYACADPEGHRGGGVEPALENHKAIGFHSNIGPDSLENAKAHSIMGHHRPTSRTPFKWR